LGFLLDTWNNENLQKKLSSGKFSAKEIMQSQLYSQKRQHNYPITQISNMVFERFIKIH